MNQNITQGGNSNDDNFQKFIKIKVFISDFIPRAQLLMKDINQYSLYNPDVKQRYKQLRQYFNEIPNYIKKLRIAVELNIDSGKVDVEECTELSSLLNKLKEQHDALKIHIQAENQEYIKKSQAPQQQQQQQQFQQQQQNQQKNILQPQQQMQPQNQIEQQKQIELQKIEQKYQQQQEQDQFQLYQKQENQNNNNIIKKNEEQKQQNEDKPLNDDDLILDLSENSSGDNEIDLQEEEQQENPKSQISVKENKKEEEEAQEACIICMDKKVTFACIPCGHFKYCEDCSELVMNKKECVLCRQQVVSVIKIFT